MNSEQKYSRVVTHCQICASADLRSILFLGYLPPVNQMHALGQAPDEEKAFPAQLLICPRCELVQLGLVVDKKILFPVEYPYTSSTTKILRENFAELYQESQMILPLRSDDLVLDIGSNDGNLLSNFVGKHRVLGVTPEDIGKLAIARGIPTIQDYFTEAVAKKICEDHGKPKLITATNVFAHIDAIHDVIAAILSLMSEDGIFISESHYLLPLVETLQYDTIYHEHLRYYSLRSLNYLFEKHGLEIIHAKPIPTHGGSIRVYTSRKGRYPVRSSVNEQLAREERQGLNYQRLLEFRDRVARSKLELMALLKDIKQDGKKIYGISAPSRASTLIHYVGIDDGIMDCVLEIKGSHKVGKYMPGTIIPVEDEAKLFSDQPDYALLLSWHIADELMPKLAAKGFKGGFIVPLPTPRIVRVG